ncbi:MAG: tRNA 4-thiouridine(8) synthase ThiI [Clostridiales bacterium]|jgi:thiamine biosynthesis protein ThiI|nr:tRNA 4-thiouridine(8) synthase ThiI [Clostridiales bacterium]
MKEALLIKYGEIALRGNNRNLFEKQLCRDVQKRLAGYDIRVNRENGRFLAESRDPEFDYMKVAPLAAKVFGIIGVCPCVKSNNRDIENIIEMCVEYLKRQRPAGPFTFKVLTKRGDKQYPITSQEISAKVGRAVLEVIPGTTVDLHNPQVTLFVEVRNHVFIYAQTVKAHGGLPYGSSGKGALLLSGGIDSPVAGYLMAKRGVEITAVYFHSPPYTSERAREKVTDLSKVLAGFTGYFKLHVVTFTQVQLLLNQNVPAAKLTILLKRSMLRISEQIALKENCQSLVTGDSIGQVASQTMQSLLAVQSAVKLPIIRPLAGMDKQEIIDISRKIEAYDISVRPYDDCCTLFVADHPETKPKASIIENVEKGVEGLAEAEAAAIAGVEVQEFRFND